MEVEESNERTSSPWGRAGDGQPPRVAHPGTGDGPSTGFQRMAERPRDLPGARLAWRRDDDASPEMPRVEADEARRVARRIEVRRSVGPSLDGPDAERRPAAGWVGRQRTAPAHRHGRRPCPRKVDAAARGRDRMRWFIASGEALPARLTRRGHRRQQHRAAAAATARREKQRRAGSGAPGLAASDRRGRRSAAGHLSADGVSDRRFCGGPAGHATAAAGVALARRAVQSRAQQRGQGQQRGEEDGEVHRDFLDKTTPDRRPGSRILRRSDDPEPPPEAARLARSGALVRLRTLGLGGPSPPSRSPLPLPAATPPPPCPTPRFSSTSTVPPTSRS